MNDLNLQRRAFLAGAFGLGAVALVGCKPAKGGGAPDVKGAILKIAVVSSYVNKKIRLTGLDYVIEKQGFLRDELKTRGISLEWFPAPNAAVGPIVNEAFANHSIQLAGYSDLPSIILNASNTTGKTKLVIPGNPGDSYLVVPKNSTAKSIEDLKGKRLAIHRGRPWELPLLRLLESKGLSYADFQIFNINPEAGAAAVATGGVDGLFTVSAFNLEDKGVAKIIWSTADQPLSWKSWGGTWAARSFIEEQPEIAQLVVDAYVKAAYWVSHDENKAEIIKLGTLNGTPERIVRRTYDESGISWKDRWSPLFPPELYEHYREATAFAKKYKIITGDIDIDVLLDDSLAKKSLKTLGIENYWTGIKTFTPAAPAQASSAKEN